MTIDTHPPDHISHANRWVNAVGEHPTPFTIITHEAMLDGEWQAARPEDQAWQLEYLRRLKRPHYIWPVHGQRKSWEWYIQDDVRLALISMSVKFTIVEKGMHRDTEQFGAFGAEVPYPGSPETDINHDFIRAINKHKRIIIAGEASSHCAMDSVNQLLDAISPEDASKVIVFRDCMSPVAQAPGGPDFPAQAEAWLATLRQRGVTVTTSTEYALETQ